MENLRIPFGCHRMDLTSSQNASSVKPDEFLNFSLPYQQQKFPPFPLRPLNSADLSIFSEESINSNLKKGMWTLQEDQLLVEAVKHNDARNWKAIANMIPGRTFSQCSQRWRRMQPRKLRLPWTKTEDRDVLDLVSKYGSNWSEIAKHVESRSGKQIRERFINKLNRDINRSKFTEEEDMKILKRWKELGPKWQQIAKESQGRSENMIKNRFYSHIKKKYLQNTEKTIIENNSNEIKDNFLEEFGQLETDFDKEKIKEKMIVDENLKNKRCFYEVFDSNEIFNFHTQNFEEEDLRSVKTHYDFLKKKKELLENTLLSLNEKINRFELRERVPEQ